MCDMGMIKSIKTCPDNYTVTVSKTGSLRLYRETFSSVSPVHTLSSYAKEQKPAFED